jgi:hypothetical protein
VRGNAHALRDQIAVAAPPLLRPEHCLRELCGEAADDHEEENADELAAFRDRKARADERADDVAYGHGDSEAITSDCRSAKQPRSRERGCPFPRLLRDLR